MTEAEKLQKETFELLREVVNVLVEDKLTLVRKFVDLEARVNKFNESKIDKPELFGKQPVVTQQQQPTVFPVTQPQPFPAKPVGDPLKQGMAGNFDHLPDPPEEKKTEPVVKPGMALPFDNEDVSKPKFPPVQKPVDKEVYPWDLPAKPNPTVGEKISALTKKDVEAPF